MGIIKLGLISLFVFALIITGFSLFIPSHIRISKAIDINVSRDSVMSQVSDANNWKKWYPGADSMELLLVDGKVKGIYSKTDQRILVTAVNDSTVLAVNSGANSKGGEIGWNFFPNTNSSTTIQWYMDFHLKWYPWEKFSSLMLEKRYGPIMEKGLANLKTLLEK